MSKTLPIAGVFVLGLLAMGMVTFTPASVSTVSAHKGATGIVKKRMGEMKKMKDHLKAIEQMLEGKKRYNTKKVHRALDYIGDHAGARMSKLFPKGSTRKPSEADPAIWKNWDEFRKMAVSLNHSTDEFRAKLPKNVDKDALKSLQKEALSIRKACKVCHDRFRL